ncbi:hypothetical protein DAPPUDRAFT_322179 [Daphnia pulex]|uniref:Uncharacterized protein n=1 Tax=Daphnia pulex TaxID=6669 RepID=E9GV03_DAPPU|nr:hypothetical protein DAPPUDRAFT_337882 [Daphnia pulex]EFX76581.1 hypothetical protein DAPPUDRAFT_322179 [Daphnia pulex]|eukprot:EFX61887.1 hypothetical protein DAPPUDRAFT_337882 [Daphnia pulex]
MGKTPVPINPIWDSFTNKTRFVEDLKIQNGNRLVLWKNFRPQAYSSDGNLRTVHHMELRTLKKMGFT